MPPACPHCGQPLGPAAVPGKVVACPHCGRAVLVNEAAAPPPDPAEEAIRAGTAARCPSCQQLVEVRDRTTGRTRVPHYLAGGQKRICPGSGKAVADAPPAEPGPARLAPAGKDLSRYMTRDVLRVVSCRKGSPPRIEQLSLEYLDRSDRVRIQVEALRDILGPAFRMRDYPPALHRPELAVWGNETDCVIGKRDARGGYETMSDAELAAAVADVQEHPEAFFP